DGLDASEIYLFGSFASGVPTPRSDVDLLIISENAAAHVFLPYFLSISVPVDIHVMTPASFNDKRKSGRGVAGAAVTKGTRLL
ncbi:MAG: nucleotidyltransferase domain-containing protein, partial [Deltaproteobacteria bacterium]|nr:nucleotidyltransferase domain-containing protein [Deltaproteobacteria bacterium]